VRTPFAYWTGRKALIVLHDVVATGVALLTTLYVRFEQSGLEQRQHWLFILLPLFLMLAAGVYQMFRLYDAKWRFASLPDLFNIFRAVTVLSVVLLTIDYALFSSQLYGTFFFGKISILLYWCLQIFFLGGPRLVYRYFRYTRTRRQARVSYTSPVLILGRSAEAEVLLRAIESGAVTRIEPAGILSPSPADQGTSIRNVAVLGTLDDLESVVDAFKVRETPVQGLILTPTAMLPEEQPERLLARARRLDLTARQLPSLDVSGELPDGRINLVPIAVEDLLLRPSARIDYQRLDAFVRGASVVVTGGGGSIGTEICRRIISFGAKRLLIIENAEPALYSIIEELDAIQTPSKVEGRLADVRDRARIFELFRDFQPDLVFHAAALKHVSMLETNWSEGIKTNVFGSVNVADAAKEVGARAMVLVSTDKAIEPVSVLGATKRFAEMYCQSLDDEGRKGPDATATRFIAVRFGNVLASNGSVVPKFKAQIEAGGPVTITHPEMVRYFMTIREACDLVITAASHAVGSEASKLAVYVLNMGQPVKILDLARRMIMLSGYEPDRDIEITFTGMKPGERLNEILFAREEPTIEIGVHGVVATTPVYPTLEAMHAWIADLETGLRQDQRASIYRVMKDAIPDFRNEWAFTSSPTMHHGI
jgi:O-antigen biosynthesis protein WbqV